MLIQNLGSAVVIFGTFLQNKLLKCCVSPYINSW